ncbi:MAG TPA: sulfatase, partial [Acidobacteriota bacterium]
SGAKKRKVKIDARHEELSRFVLENAWRDYEMTVPAEQLRYGSPRLRFVFTGKNDGASPWADFEFFELPSHHWMECELRNEMRPAFVVPMKSRMSFRLTLPSGSPKLYVGIGALYKRKKPLDVTFEIGVKTGWTVNKVYRKTLRFTRDRQEWVDERIDLADYAGQSVTIDFQNTTQAEYAGLVAWSSPEIYDVSAKRDRPNIILFSVDTLRKDRVSYYGKRALLTPNLDALAGKSYVYGNALCTYPGTLSSHTSVLTGWYVAQHKVRKGAEVLSRRRYIAPEWISIAELASRANYRTAAITDGGHLSPFYGFQQGFQQYYQNESYDKFNTVATLENGLAWLETHSERPFFLFLHTYRVHEPFQASYEVFRRLFPDFPLPDRANPRISGGDLTKLMKGEVPLTETRKKMVQNVYDAGVFFFDQRFGIFCKKLEQLGLMKNTVILLFADHGEQLFDRGRGFGHGKSLRPEEIQVPVILYMPGRGHQDYPGVVSLVDIYPTLAEIMKARLPHAVDGKSLLGSAEQRQPERTVYYEVSFGHEEMFWGMQNDQYKLVFHPSSGKEFFYDIRKDPQEINDLRTSALPAMKEMKDLLRTYIE